VHYTATMTENKMYNYMMFLWTELAGHILHIFIAYNKIDVFDADDKTATFDMLASMISCLLWV